MKVLRNNMIKIAAIVFLTLFSCSTGYAYVYDLNYVLEWDESDYGSLTVDPSFGTVTTENVDGNTVKVTIDLAEAWKIQGFLMNYDPSLGDMDFVAYYVVDSTKNLIALSDIGGDGWKAYFDLSAISIGESSPFVFYITSEALISMDTFNFPTEGGGDYFAVHVGSFPGAEDDLRENEASIWVSSRSIPEPATIFLLGSGLIGLAGVARRKRIK